MTALNVDIAWRLTGEMLPAVRLPSTAGDDVDLGQLRGHWSVLFTYPKNMVDMPGVTRPANWYERPGCPG